MESKAVRLRIHDLLDGCKKCPKNHRYSIRKANEVCGHCEVFQELRQLGDLLFKPQPKEVIKMPGPITVEEYLQLKKQGLKDVEIAKMKGVSKQTIANWKYAKKDKLKAAQQNVKEPSTPKELEELKKQLEELAEQYNAISSAYEDSQKEIVVLKNNNELLKKMLKRMAKRKSIIDGVGKDAPTVVNEQGGKQSKVLYRFDLLDPRAMFEMTKVLEAGAKKYGEENWRLISVKEHLNHMIIHAYAYLAGDKQDDHLSHLLCRAMFALGVELQNKEKTSVAQ